jgi:hypothetical protein
MNENLGLAMATRDQIRDAMHRQPFRPFTVRLVDGRSFEVQHPDFIAVSDSDRARDLTIYSGSMHRIDLLHVTEIEQSITPSSPAADGGGNVE